MTRKTMLLAFAASGLLFAGAAHALPEGWYTLGPGIPYKCHGNHVVAGGVTPISTYTHVGAEDIRTCQAACDRTPGCVAFSFERRTVRDGFGRDVHLTTCTLLGSSRARTEAMSDRGRFDWGAVCYRDMPLGNPTDIDWRRELRLDQYRPGVPGPGVPHSNPNKP